MKGDLTQMIMEITRVFLSSSKVSFILQRCAGHVTMLPALIRCASSVPLACGSGGAVNVAGGCYGSSR